MQGLRIVNPIRNKQNKRHADKIQMNNCTTAYVLQAGWNQLLSMDPGPTASLTSSLCSLIRVAVFSKVTANFNPSKLFDTFCFSIIYLDLHLHTYSIDRAKIRPARVATIPPSSHTTALRSQPGFRHNPQSHG